MKRALLVAIFAMGAASIAGATNHKMAGCGLGAMIFKESEKPHQILAATTNGSFGNQTFGISSETLGCTKDGMVKADKKREVYASVNLQKLSSDMAKGSGEYLTAFASMMGCTEAGSQQAFSKYSQENFESLLPTAETGAGEFLSNVSAGVQAHPELGCTL